MRWLSVKDGVPARGYWDQALLEDIFAALPEGGDRQIVVIPGAYQFDCVDAINEELRQYERVLVVVTSDEESRFDPELLEHPDMLVFSTYPVQNRRVDYWLPIGYTPHCKPEFVDKDVPYSFAGQVNHDSRRRLMNELKRLRGGRLLPTNGFAQGLHPFDYMSLLSRTRVVPSPGGPVTPDSFRMYEALEAGAIPIPENPAFYRMLFDDTPFAVLDTWEKVGDYIGDYAARYPALNNQVFAWWQQQKRIIREQFRTAINADPGAVTVVLPTSPIPSHPSTEVIDETIGSIRDRLDCEIIVTVDGVREQQEHRRADYEEYTRRLLWKANHVWGNVTPILFDSQVHQVAMARAAMNLVNTPTILYIEHDTPLTGEFEWAGLTEAVTSGRANMIRFHFEEHVLDVHQHMMLDRVPEMVAGVPLLRTAQWSQRPHLASSDFYRRILADHFTPDANTFIEDKMHGVLHSAHERSRWGLFKVWMYAPPGSIKRSYTTDGRRDDPKFEADMVF